MFLGRIQVFDVDSSFALAAELVFYFSVMSDGDVVFSFLLWGVVEVKGSNLEHYASHNSTVPQAFYYAELMPINTV